MDVDLEHRAALGTDTALALAHQLRRCDEEGVAAYLESTNPANLTLYERHGFRTVGRIEVAPAPPVHPMLRPVGGGGR